MDVLNSSCSYSLSLARVRAKDAASMPVKTQPAAESLTEPNSKPKDSFDLAAFIFTRLVVPKFVDPKLVATSFKEDLEWYMTSGGSILALLALLVSSYLFLLSEIQASLSIESLPLRYSSLLESQPCRGAVLADSFRLSNFQCLLLDS